MRRSPSWLLGPLLAIALAQPAQAQPSDRRQLARELRELLDRRFEAPPPQTSTEVTLALSVEGRRPLAVGDVLSFRLRVRNGSSRRITLPPARCPFWSTRDPRLSGYVLELLSEDGEPVPMALGWARESCTFLTRDEEPSPVTVEPGAEQPLEAPPEVMRDVRPSARPGRYRMRVRYLDGPRIYASNEVQVVIAGGSERLWACRRAMIDRIYEGTTLRHEQPAVVPADPSDPARGLFVLFSRNALGRGAAAVTVELARMRPDGSADPSSQTLLRAEPPFSARVEAGWSSSGLIVAASLAHGRVSLASVEIGPSGAARVTRSAEIGATYPDYFGLAVRGDRVALAYGEVMDGPLYLSLFDGRGVARGAPIEVARRAAPTRTAVSLDEAGGWIIWNERRRRGLRMRRFSLSGQLGPVREIPIVADPIALRGDASGADLTLADRISEHEGPTDLMGMLAVRVGADGSITSRAPISPQDRMDAHEGSAAWAGDRLGAAFSIDWSRLVVAAGGRQRELSQALRGLPSVTSWGEGFAVAWADERDDTTPTCRDRRGCVTEVYVAAIDASGALRIPPSRVTRGAQPEPRPIMNDGWERDCPP